jgi:hypothetical protein
MRLYSIERLELALNIMLRALQATAFTFDGDAIVINSGRNV